MLTSDVEFVIEAGRTERHYWRDVLRFRELLYFLAWRDFLVRYKQAAIGIAWAVLRPALIMLVFTLVFGKLAGLPSGDVPYAIMVSAAVLPWYFFASAFTDAANSLVTNASMVSKAYFPRLILPASSVLVSLADFLIALAILAGLMLWYGFAPDWRIVTLPLFALLAFATALGAGLWVAALNVKYRDFRFIVPFIVQLGLYISPVGFASDLVPDKWRTLYSLNPMVGVIDGFRWALLGGTTQLHWPGFAVSLLVVTVLMVAGIAYFRRTERGFADTI